MTEIARRSEEPLPPERVAEARRQLELASTPEDIKEIIARSAAVRQYLERIGASVEVRTELDVLDLDARRKGGRLLAEMGLRGGDRRSNRRAAGLKPKLGENGMPSQDESRRWQRLASIPEKYYQRKLLELIKQRRRPTVGAFLRLACDLENKRNKLSEAEKAAREMERIAIAERIDLRLGDFMRVLADYPEESVDLLFTDPPYSTAYLKLWPELGNVAMRVLKEGSFLIAYAGHYALLEKMNALAEAGLRYYWQIASLHSVHPWMGRTRSAWKPIVVFTKGAPGEPEWFSDLIRPKGTTTEAKQYHEWAQPLDQAHYLIDKFSAPGDMVLDPMCGSATIPLAAALLGRFSVGVELDPEHYKRARERLSEY